MEQFNTLMNEVLKLLPRRDFKTVTDNYCGDRYTRYFDTWQQLLVLLYAQIKGMDSLREIETSLTVHQRKWYHLGLKGIKRSTLADAMNRRPSEIFEELFYCMAAKCQSFSPKKKFRFKNPLYALDASVISLCLNIFPWAKFRTRKGAIKLHCLYDQDYGIPSFLSISDGKKHEVTAAKNDTRLALELKPDSIVAMDKGYIDFKWLHGLEHRGVYFVTRSKVNMNYRVAGQHDEIKNKQVISDEIIYLKGVNASEDYPDRLRLVKYIDRETGKIYKFLTNIFHLAAKTIADIYGSRWKIEEFFRWIKQNLKIKSFLGTSPDAVMTQVWVAMCYYLLLTFIKFQSRFNKSLTELSRMIKSVLLERMSLIQLLRQTSQGLIRIRDPELQPALF